MSIRRNTLYNLLGAGVPLAVSLLTVPTYLEFMGEARYGVLAIAWLLLGYFGLFDLGLGRATAQRIAALKDSAAEDRARIFWTALSLNAGLGIIGGLLIWPAAIYFFGNVFKVEDALRAEVVAAVPWLVIAVPMATLTGVLTGALQGRERFFELNIISIVGTLLFQLLPLIVAVFYSVELSVILPVVQFSRLITLLFLFGCCSRYVFGGCPVLFDRSQVGQLVRFGGWITVSSFVGPMMVVLDRFIIGALSGAKAVSYYTVPFQLGERSTVIASALVTTLFPRFALVSREEELRLAHEGLRSIVVVMTPLVAVGILIMKPFLSYWITPDFAERSAFVGQIILLAFWFNGFALIPLAQLQARGRPDLVAKCHLAELIPYSLMLYAGLKLWGMSGAALAFAMRVLIDFALLAKLAGAFRETLKVLIIPVLLLSSIFLISNLYTGRGMGWFFLVAFHLLVIFIWSWWQAPFSIRSAFLRSARV